MSLIVALGSNIGNSLEILVQVRTVLDKRYQLIAASKVYRSKAVDYESQPDFFNQVLELRLPALHPSVVMEDLLDIEKIFGRNRNIPKGPRTLDLDIIFWGLENYKESALIIPHPRWMERSFVVRPLKELPFFQTIEKCFTIPKIFDVEATPIL